MEVVSLQAHRNNETEAIRLGFVQAIKAATQKMGATAPNPAVGCALLDRAGRVLSVGAHPAVGQPHAEVMAVEQARKAGVLGQAYSALVTLEPCHHHGRTPPCSELLQQSPMQDIWIGLRDPNPHAAGGGAFLAGKPHPKRVFCLEDHVEFASLAQQCRALAAPFATRITQGRPWLTVKQALDGQGSMIPPRGQTTFTSPKSLTFAHQLRRATDAVVTGIGTVLADDPSFTVRHVKDHPEHAPRPLIVLDRQGRTPPAWVKAREADGFQVEICPQLEAVPALLGQMGVNWALIEAGPALLASVKEASLWDDWLTIHKGATVGDDEGEDMWDICLRDTTSQKISPVQLLRDYGE